MASFLNASIMSNVTSVLNMGADAVKFARQAVKGMGQDARFFRDSKKGEPSVCSECRPRPLPTTRGGPSDRPPLATPAPDATAPLLPSCTQARSASSARSFSRPTSTS
jgi:hypothetical protein